MNRKYEYATDKIYKGVQFDVQKLNILILKFMSVFVALYAQVALCLSFAFPLPFLSAGDLWFSRRPLVQGVATDICTSNCTP